MLEKIRALVGLIIGRTILKIYFSAQLFLARSALSVAQLARLLIRYEIRRADPSLSVPGDFQIDDTLVHVVYLELLNLEPDPSDKDLAAMHPAQADKLRQQAQKSNEVKEALTTVHLALHNFHLLANNVVQAEQEMSRAKQLAPTSTPLSPSGLAQKKREMKARLRLIRQELEDRYGFKIDISFSDLAGLIGTWSVLFFISGYLYASTLLHAFDVDASKFFNLSDYLAASVEQIKYAGLATACGALTFLAGAFDRSRLSNAQLKTEHPRRSRIQGWIKLFLGALLALSTWSFFYSREHFFGTALMTGVIFSVITADYVGARAFKNPLPATALLTALLTFIVHMTIGVSKEIYLIENGKYPTAKSDIKIKDPADSQLSNSRILAGTASYIVFLSEDRTTVTVVPRERLEYIKINRQLRPDN